MAEAKRKLAAILSADVVGYSRLMQDDDEATRSPPVEGCGLIGTGRLPVLSLKGAVLFPGMRCGVILHNDRARMAVEMAADPQGSGLAAVFADTRGQTLDPEPDELFDS